MFSSVCAVENSLLFLQIQKKFDFFEDKKHFLVPNEILVYTKIMNAGMVTQTWSRNSWTEIFLFTFLPRVEMTTTEG